MSMNKDILTGAITLGVGFILVATAIFYPRPEGEPDQLEVVDKEAEAQPKLAEASPTLPPATPKTPALGGPDKGTRKGIGPGSLEPKGGDTKQPDDGSLAHKIDAKIPKKPPTPPEKTPEPVVAKKTEPPEVPEVKPSPPTFRVPKHGPRIRVVARPKTYEVQPGDTFQKISEKEYGTTQRAQLIMDANPEVGERDLMPRMVLTIPPDPDPIVAMKEEPPAKGTGILGRKGDEREQAAPEVGKLYTVAKGDNYESISLAHYGSRRYARELMEENGIGEYDLKVGQKLRIPDLKVERQPVAAKTPPAIPSGARTHTLQAGEVLGDVARRYLGTSTRWREIADLNGITNPKRVPVGMKLVIPDVPADKAPAKEGRTAGGVAATELEPGADYIIYTVQPGDTYQKIAKLHYGFYSKHDLISQANPKYPATSLPVGAKIRVPKIADVKLPKETRRVLPKATRGGGFSLSEGAREKVGDEGEGPAEKKGRSGSWYQSKD